MSLTYCHGPLLIYPGAILGGILSPTAIEAIGWGGRAGLGAHMDEGDILRQRRNLVAMSCLLIIFDLAKVEVACQGWCSGN